MTAKILLGALIVALLTTSATALIASPTNATYTGPVPVNLTANGSQDSIAFAVDGYTNSCTNCSSLHDVLNLSDGEYTLSMTSTLGNETLLENVTFTVQLPQPNETNTTQPVNNTDFTVLLLAPTNKTYNASVPVKLSANTTLDSLAYAIGGRNGSCTNCSVLERNESLGNGTYTIVATGRLGNESKSISLDFSVLLPGNLTNATNQTNTTKPSNQTNTTVPKNETGNGTPKFAVGLNKLPQMVEDGEINDSELARIIRDNQLNPGVLNRLIKTGRLGNESIEAIIATQEPPKGIFRKLLGWTGLFPTPHEKLVDTYALTAEQETLLLEQDIPTKIKEKVEQSLAKKEAPGQAKKDASPAAREAKAEKAPGQEKKAEKAPEERGKPVRESKPDKANNGKPDK